MFKCAVRVPHYLAIGWHYCPESGKQMTEVYDLGSLCCTWLAVLQWLNLTGLLEIRSLSEQTLDWPGL